VQGSDGVYIGTTFAGSVSIISTNGVLTTLHSFKGSIIGYPVGGLAQGTTGICMARRPATSRAMTSGLMIA